MADETLHPETLAVTAGRPPHEPDQPLNTPITMASTYVAGGELEYGRYGNPTWSAFEDALGALGRGRCLAFASGLAAVATVLDLVAVGEKVVVPRHAYQGSLGQLDDLEMRGRVKPVRVDIEDTDAVVKACEDASLVWVESPTNPALEVADLPAIIAAAHDEGAYVAVDNTFATPVLQRPLELGADLVVHSATKFIAGHSDVVLGALLTRDDELYAVLKGRRDLLGAVPGPFETWLALRGLRTLPLRIERAQANAAELARRLREPARGLRGALPGLRRHPRHRAGARGDGRRPAHAHDPAVGARDQPRRGRVDLRATPPLAHRGADHRRVAGADVRRDRARRRPVGRPGAGAGAAARG
jgi:cystathionine gamma-synthase